MGRLWHIARLSIFMRFTALKGRLDLSRRGGVNEIWWNLVVAVVVLLFARDIYRQAYCMLRRETYLFEIYKQFQRK